MSDKAYDDPNVKAALGNGRRRNEISLICCHSCGRYGYYNDGSHFSCRFEDCGWSASGETMDVIIENGDVITLEDYDEMMAEIRRSH